MSKFHRRILPAKESRCHPPNCPLKAQCARFTCPLPAGIGATMGNFSGSLIYTDAGPICSKFLSVMVSDDEIAAQQKTVKPPIGSNA